MDKIQDSSADAVDDTLSEVSLSIPERLGQSLRG